MKILYGRFAKSFILTIRRYANQGVMSFSFIFYKSTWKFQINPKMLFSDLFVIFISRKPAETLVTDH